MSRKRAIPREVQLFLPYGYHDARLLRAESNERRLAANPRLRYRYERFRRYLNRGAKQQKKIDDTIAGVKEMFAARSNPFRLRGSPAVSTPTEITSI